MAFGMILWDNTGGLMDGPPLKRLQNWGKSPLYFP